MAKSMLGIGVMSRFPKESIISIAKRVLNFFLKLSTLKGSSFSFKYLKENGDGMSIDYLKDETIQLLAEAIVEDNKADIAKYEKENAPNVNFTRDVGFCPSFYLYDGDKKICSILTRFGAVDGGGISLTNFNHEVEKDFEWYYSILALMVDTLEPHYGLVNFNNTSSNKLFSQLQVKYLIGWATYFSNDFQLNIPNNLPGFEYIFTDRGKYLILTHEDITQDKSTYEQYRKKLIDTMNFLKEQVPGYSK